VNAAQQRVWRRRRQEKGFYLGKMIMIIIIVFTSAREGTKLNYSIAAQAQERSRWGSYKLL
jgi:hypothetical protein